MRSLTRPGREDYPALVRQQAIFDEILENVAKFGAKQEEVLDLVMNELELRLQSRRFPPLVPPARRTNSSMPSDPHLPTAAANTEFEGSATITQAPLSDLAKDAV